MFLSFYKDSINAWLCLVSVYFAILEGDKVFFDISHVGINVMEYAESKAYEIKNLKKAITDANSTQSGLAFQKVPRHMRRRAASHDVRRIPKRIRPENVKANKAVSNLELSYVSI